MTTNEVLPVTEKDGAKLYVHQGGKTGGIGKGSWDIGLSLKGKTVTDFDGCFELPAFAVELLRSAGFRFADCVLP